ncbi:hypothetical protein C9439_02650 [archaeon SCG-AAA382B04]|nr:hypothetical protein C9439_02650 [archaeon SCG-AAA382B04]
MKPNIQDKATEISSYLEESDFIRCISHNDADGLAAAGILSESMRKLGKQFHTSIVGRPSEEIIEKINDEDDCSVILFDMGSGQPELIKKIDSEVAVVDHHPPSYEDEIANHHLNPHHYGIDGSFSASASTLSYLVCKNLPIENADLGCVSLAGAIGDMQHLPMDGLNLEILNEMRSKNVIEIKKGLRFTDKINKSLEKSTSPFLKGISGNSLTTQKILKSLDINGNETFWELQEDKKRKLISFIVLKLIKQGAEINRIKSTIGEVYEVNNKEFNYVSELSSLLNACGTKDEYGLALSLVLGPKQRFEEAEKIKNEHKSELLKNINEAIENLNEQNNLYHIEVDHRASKGTVCGILVDYVFTDKPIFTYYIDEDEISISSRGNKLLIERNLDLSEVMKKAANEVGGNGGGHNIASGATIPKNELKNFLKKANEMIGEQL